MKKNYRLLGVLLVSTTCAVMAADPPPKPGTEPTGRAGSINPGAKAGTTSITVLRKEASNVTSVQFTRCNAGPSGHCFVDLTIKPDCSMAFNHPELFIVPGAKVYTEIKTTGWTFDPAAGLKFKDAAAPFTGSLFNPTTWVVQANPGSAGRGRFAYAVKVKNEKGQVCEVDPGYWL